MHLLSRICVLANMYPFTEQVEKTQPVSAVCKIFLSVGWMRVTATCPVSSRPFAIQEYQGWLTAFFMHIYLHSFSVGSFTGKTNRTIQQCWAWDRSLQPYWGTAIIMKSRTKDPGTREKNSLLAFYNCFATFGQCFPFQTSLHSSFYNAWINCLHCVQKSFGKWSTQPLTEVKIPNF